LRKLISTNSSLFEKKTEAKEKERERQEQEEREKRESERIDIENEEDEDVIAIETQQPVTEARAEPERPDNERLARDGERDRLAAVEKRKQGETRT